MSWLPASLVILALALAAGFAWYERQHPSARVLALVGALAALAVIGRIAFAAVPNVKPTTDIVLFSGFALGGAPGFAVGALAALVSNLFFGQGPWTPWQMAAWGSVGLFGAGLARLSRGRELGRVPLAIACGFAGLFFGVVMDAFQWTLTEPHTVASYATISAASLTFNVAHAIGNVVFCLLIGPAFVRALRRYQRRFEFRWAAPASAAAAVALALVVALPPGTANAASPTARAIDFLRSAQNSDGGFGAARGQGSTQLHSGWVALGLAATDRNPRAFQRDGRSAIDYMRGGAGSLNDTGELERTILVLRASGLSPRDFSGRDLIAELQRRRKGDGSYGTVNWTAFAVMALRASGVGGTGKSVAYLVKQQNGDGGFGFSTAAASDADDTGSVLQALAAGGKRGSLSTRRALAYLKKTQHSDGGWGQMPSQPSNAQSTAWAVQGIVAAGRSPSSFGGRDALAYLRGLQRGDGSFRYSRSSAQTPVWVTAQALVALQRKSFPLQAVAMPARQPSAAQPPSAAGAKPRARKKQKTSAKNGVGSDAGAALAPPTPSPQPAASPPSESGNPASARVPARRGNSDATTAWAIAAVSEAELVLLAELWWCRSREMDDVLPRI